MESGDHMDAHQLTKSEETFKHNQHGDFTAAESLLKSEQIASVQAPQAAGTVENLLLLSGVTKNKGVSAKRDIHEFLLHESGASLPRNEFDHSPEQGPKESENTNSKFLETSQNDEPEVTSNFSFVNPNSQQDSLHRISKGLGDEISTEENLKGSGDVAAESVASKEDLRNDSLSTDKNVTHVGKSSLQSNESHLSQEISVESVEQASIQREEEGEKVSGSNTDINISADVHPKVEDEANKLEDNSNKGKEDEVSDTKAEIIVSGELIHSERSEIPIPEDKEKGDVPVAEKHLEFISHESDLKNSNSDGISGAESKGMQFISTEKSVSEFQKDDSDSFKPVNILQGESDLKPAMTENADQKLKTADEQPTTNDEKEEEWLDIVGSGQLMKKILRKAENEYRPQNSFICEINLEGRLEDGTVVEKHENMKIQVGDFEVVQGIDLALPLMNVGEVALLEVGPRFAYGSLGSLPDIPPDAKLTYQIELLSAENEPDMESLSIAERRQIGEKKRERGNWWYSRKEYSFAIRSYRRALEFLDDAEEGFSVEKKEVAEDTEKQFQELLEERLKVYNNLAAAHIMNKSYDAALTSVENVLRCQPQNVKALQRKSKILAAKGDAAAALSILRNASQLEPDSPSIKQEMQRLQDVIKRDTKQEKSLYKKMLGQAKTAGKAAPKTPKISYRTWGIVCSSVAVVLLGAVAYRYKFL